MAIVNHNKHLKKFRGQEEKNVSGGNKSGVRSAHLVVFLICVLVFILVSLIGCSDTNGSLNSSDDSSVKEDTEKETEIVIEADNQLEIVNGHLEIPAEINGLPVVGIGELAFADKTQITSVSIPNSVVSIGNSAFKGCTSLTSMTLPFVGAAFNGTENTHFGYIFGASGYGANGDFVPASLKEVVITGESGIADNAFRYCRNITSITIPDSITRIGDSVFWGCSSLTEVTIPSGVTSIGNSAFCYCESITNITIPDSVTSIGERAFENCTGLKDVNIGNGVTAIGRYALNNCKSLTSVSIPFVGATPNGTENTHFGYIFGASSYRDNDSWVPPSLKEVIIRGGNSIGYSAFFDCPHLTSITIPDSVTSIDACAFFDCIGLTSVAIPSGVTEIGNNAFENCKGLTSIILPKGVTRVGTYAFLGCTNLTICCEASSEPSGWGKDWCGFAPVVWGYKEN